MNCRSLFVPVLFFLGFPLLAQGDSITTRQIQNATARVEAQEKQGGLTQAQIRNLQETLHMMTADQIYPALFRVDRAILEARFQGILQYRQRIEQARNAVHLKNQLANLKHEHQVLAARYSALRQQLAQKTMAGAQTQHMEQKIRQQEKTIRQEEGALAEMKTPGNAGNNSSPASALSAYGSVRTGRNGVHLQMPVSTLFQNSHILSTTGLERLRAVASALQRVETREILVRVAPRPGGTNLATQRAERILRTLRKNGIPDQRLALATGSGLPEGTAELFLVNAAENP